MIIRPTAAAGLLAMAIGCSSMNEDTQRPEYKIIATVGEPFGTVDGEQVYLYTLTNANGMVLKATNYGATITELHVPDRDAKLADVVLGFDTLEAYQQRSPYFGCMAGRVANRIALGQFELDGRQYQLAVNNGPNHLHGGVKGFDKVVWIPEMFADRDGPGIRFTYNSPDGDEGYPGALDVTVEYVLSDDNELIVRTTAEARAPTIVNIVHHTYWNLGGHDSGTILDEELMIKAESYTPTDETLIPTGDIVDVAGTPYDFREMTRIGDQIDDVPPIDENDPGGYDLNYVVDGNPEALRLAAALYDPSSGRRMEIWADQPGIQFYTGNWLADLPGKGGAVYDQYAGLCLETQKFPDAVNKRGVAGWPSVELRPGETYTHLMMHRFSVE